MLLNVKQKLVWQMYYGASSFQQCEFCVVKCPARDACLCMGDLQAPHFVFLITL